MIKITKPNVGKVKGHLASNPVSKLVRPMFDHPSARNIFGGIPLLLAMVLTGTVQMPISAFGFAGVNTVAAYEPAGILAVSLETHNSVVFPVNPNEGLSQDFHALHPGIDIRAKLGSPIKAAMAGTVVYTGYDPFGYGNHIIVDHGSGVQTLYAHMSKILVQVGDMVTNENTLGYVGLTGHTTGPHLHFEVRVNNVKVDPIPFLARQ